MTFATDSPVVSDEPSMGQAAAEDRPQHSATDWPWLAALLLAGFGALWLAHGWLRAPVITNDGYQYLDAALNVASGRCLCTNFVHFDDQVAAGHMPAALTHYPPGYPLLIAGLSRFGLPLETAGYLISAAGFLLSIWLTWDIGRMLGGRRLLTSVFVAIWIGHDDALTTASAVLTESVFTAAVMAMVALVVRDLKAEGKRPGLLAGIGGFAGLAYCLRYAGLFVIPPALLYIFWRWRRNRETLPWALAGILAACAFMIPIQVRNIIYMGYWRGMFLSKAPYSLRSAVVQAVIASDHLVFGDYLLLPIGIWTGLFLLSIFGLCLLAFRAWRRGAWTSKGGFLASALAWIGFFLLAYTGGIILAKASLVNMNMRMPDLVRYYLPVYPIVLAVLAGAVSAVRFKGLRFAASVSALAILAVHSLDFAWSPGPPEHIVIAGYLAQELYPDESLRQWLLTRISPGAAVVSEEGQALHYVLQRPVVSIIEPPENTNYPTDVAAFLSLMSRYRSRYLLLFPTIRSSPNSLPFLHGLISGKVPERLTLLVRTPYVAVYECETCAR